MRTSHGRTAKHLLHRAELASVRRELEDLQIRSADELSEMTVLSMTCLTMVEFTRETN